MVPERRARRRAGRFRCPRYASPAASSANRAMHGARRPERRFRSISTFRIGPGGHPALRRQARPPRARLRHRSAALVRRVLGQIDPNLPPSDSMPLPESRARYYRGELERLSLSPRTRPSAARAGGLPPRRRRHLRVRRQAALASLRDERRQPRLERASLSLVQAQLQTGWCRGGAELRSPSAFLGTILPSGEFDVALFGVVQRSPNPTGNDHLRLRRHPELHRLLPAAGDARPRSGGPDPRRRQQARVLNRADRADREGRAGDPALPNPARVLPFRDTRQELRSQSFESSDERGELVARAVALAAAVAVSLLAVSGAGGAGAQTPKRGGTLVIRVLGPEPACLNVLP